MFGHVCKPLVCASLVARVTGAYALFALRDISNETGMYVDVSIREQLHMSQVLRRLPLSC